MAMDNLLPNHKPNGTGLIIPFSSPVQCNDDTTPRLLPARPSAVSIDSPDDMASSSLSSPYTTRKITHESINETTSSCHRKPSHSQLTALLHAPTASAAKLLLSNNEMLARAVNKNRCMGSASLDSRKRSGGNKQTKKLDVKLNNSSCMDSYNALQEEMDEEVCIHDEIRMSDEELAEKQSETREEKRLNETVLEQQIKSEEGKQIKGTLLEQTNPALNKMPQFKTWTLHSQKNEEEMNTEPSLDLAEFPYNSPSHVSVSSEEEDAATKDVDASTPCLVSPSSSSANTENKKKPQSLDKPRTILDYAAAKTNETTPIEKATYLDCPLTFFSRVCHDSALSIPTFIKSNYNPSNETGKHKVVYPMNFVEEEGSTVMLTYIDIPQEVSSTEVQFSGTELLLHAAASEEYTESKRLQRCKKRKAADSIISLRDLGDLMKKQKSEETEPNNVEMSTMNQSTSSDPLARQAFLLADQALKDESIWKQLLLSMTIERDWTRPKAGIDEPQRGHILQKSFLWSSIPTMELVLIRHMKEYYYYSMGDKCMTKEQLEFNSRLLLDVKKCAEDMGWVWGEEFDTDRKIRNRIRCYYKSHIQNSKKRLYTILRSPTKPNHIKTLAALFHIIKDRVDDIFTDSMVDHAVDVKGTPAASSTDLSIRDVASIITDLKCCGDGTANTTNSVVDETLNSGTENFESFDVNEPFEAVDDDNNEATEVKVHNPKQAKATKEKESTVSCHKRLQMNGRKTGLLLP